MSTRGEAENVMTYDLRALIIMTEQITLSFSVVVLKLGVIQSYKRGSLICTRPQYHMVVWASSYDIRFLLTVDT